MVDDTFVPSGVGVADPRAGVVHCCGCNTRFLQYAQPRNASIVEAPAGIVKYHKDRLRVEGKTCSAIAAMRTGHYDGTPHRSCDESGTVDQMQRKESFTHGKASYRGVSKCQVI